jgi:SAM-dependent methyltransferase
MGGGKAEGPNTYGTYSSDILPFVNNVRHTRQVTTEYQSSGSEAVADAFTRYAPYYDEEQSENAIARWTRARSLQVLRRTFRQGDRVLEIGCGTGEEALYLAARGVDVLATDASEGMIEVVRAKIAAIQAVRGSTIRVTPQVLAAREIGRLVAECGPSSFAGAYSSFGPLNCEADLRPIASALADLVQPSGKVVISLLNRFCAWETTWHLAKLQRRRAFRRWAGYAEATVRAEWGDQRIPVYYWTPGGVERLFSPYFKATRRTALTWALPPPYLERLVKGRPGLFRLLAKVELSLAHLWPFNSVGDHVLLEMVRRPE